MNPSHEQKSTCSGDERNVQISLVGGQLAPVYNAIMSTPTDMVEVVYSEQTASDVNVLRESIGIPIVDSKPLSTTDPNEILARARELAEKYSNDKITLNITSGPKSWSYLFSSVLQPLKNVHIVYIDQNNILWDYTDLTHKENFVFDMRTQFKLYKNPLVSYTPISDYTKADDKVLDLIAMIRRRHPNQFNKLFIFKDGKEKHMLNDKIGCRTSSDGSEVTWDKTLVNDDGEALLSITIYHKGMPYCYNLHSPHAFDLAFNAGWFEYKVAKLFSRWAKCKEVLLNCTFPSKDASPQNKSLKNEVDVIVNAGTKIIFVECKTQIHNETDIDKFRSVVKNYGGMGSKGIFVTDAMKKPLAKEKCQQNDVIDVSFAEDFEEAKFFAMLDRMLPQLNTK